MEESVMFRELAGLWIAAFLTLCIFSFLYADNPFYKFAEHLFVGVSAGYWMAIGYWSVIVPNLFGKVLDGEWYYLLAGLMGVMLVLRLVPGISWVSRWPLAYMVGLSAGMNIVFTMQAQVLKQVSATILPLWGVGGFSDAVANWLIVFGVLTGLIYFYFSVEHRGPIFGTASRIGIWVLMIAFGAAFGYTVMARVSLLIGRIQFFTDEWWPITQAFFHSGLGGG